MKILFVGDIVGEPGREAFLKHVPLMRINGEVDFIVVNAENAAAGSGITEKITKEIFAAGADVIVLGDHAWDRKEVYALLGSEERLLRPANFPAAAPGHGSCVVTGPKGVKVGVSILMGRTFMKYLVDNPFTVADIEIGKMKEAGAVIIVADIHAEATSEKIAFAHYVDGRMSAVIGTHTHVQTADEIVLSGGTAYLTDAGMTGPYDSVIGTVKGAIIERYLTGVPNKFEVAKGPGTLCGAIVDVDETSGKARGIVRVQRT